MRTILLTLILVAAGARAGSLYEQSVAVALGQHFPDAGISYLLLDRETRAIVAASWDSSEKVAAGSLVKPFTALAYADLHAPRYPEYICAGKRAGCWLPHGHGRVGLAQAIAYSCNAYFRLLAADVPVEAIRRLGIAGPKENANSETLAGLGDGWRISPIAIARAYCELADRAEETAASEILRGMALSAQSGTGSGVSRALGEAALAKTGTAPCAHERRAPGDGYVVALHPAQHARVILLVRVHGTTGSQAAIVAGRMLRVVVRGP